jgi:hypothetical protein
MSRSPRFEVRSCRTGHLEEVHSSTQDAIDCAGSLFREWGDSYCIVDAELPRFAADGTPDDRIVWRQGEPTDAARRWIVEQNRRAMIEARDGADVSAPVRPSFRRRRQTRAQRRALATMFLMQRAYLREPNAARKVELGTWMSQIAKAASEIDAFNVWTRVGALRGSCGLRLRDRLRCRSTSRATLYQRTTTPGRRWRSRWRSIAGLSSGGERDDDRYRSS